MKLVFVHGRGEAGKDPVEMQAKWEAALQEGLSKTGKTLPTGTDIVFPFYADELDDLVKRFNAPLIEEAKAKGATNNTEELEYSYDLLSEMLRAYGVSDAQINEYIEADYREKGPLNWEIVHWLLQALDNNTEMGEAVLDQFTRDTFLYLKREFIRNEINTIVDAAIPEEPCVIVAHSMGSVVTYDILKSANAKNFDVRAFVTVGSPLGIKAIRRNLTPLTRPASIKAWFNALDERDVVSLYALDAQNFPVEPVVVNHAEVDNHTQDRHGIAGYLDDSKVAEWIWNALMS